MNFLEAYFKSKIFSEDYRNIQLEESFKHTKEEGEMALKIIQKHNSSITKEKMGKVFKISKKFSRKNQKKQINKYIKLVGVEAFKEVLIYSLRNLDNTLDEMVARSLRIDFKIRDWLRKLMQEINIINSDQFSQALEKFKNNSSSEVSIENVINSLLLVQEREDPWKLTNGIDFLEFSLTPFELDEDLYTQHIFDLLLKYAYLIEGHVVNRLDFVNDLVNIKNPQVNAESFLDKKTRMPLLLRLLDIKETAQLNKYRNSVFHQNFEIVYSLNLEERMVIFRDNNDFEESYSIKQFFEEFSRIIILINTMDFCIAEMREPLLKRGSTDKLKETFEKANPKDIVNLFLSYIRFILNDKNPYARITLDYYTF